MSIDVRVAADEIEALLRGEIPDELMQGFRGEPDEEIRIPGPDDLRVKAYWCLYAGPGQMALGRMVPSIHVSSLDFQITVAGGTSDRALFGIQIVREAIVGTEIVSGLISEIEQDLGSLRIDRGVNPPRQFLPLSFRLEP